MLVNRSVRMGIGESSMAEPLAEIVKIIIISKINIINDLIELAIELDEAKKFRMGFFFT